MTDWGEDNITGGGGAELILIDLLIWLDWLYIFMSWQMVLSQQHHDNNMTDTQKQGPQGPFVCYYNKTILKIQEKYNSKIIMMTQKFYTKEN